MKIRYAIHLRNYINTAILLVTTITLINCGQGKIDKMLHNLDLSGDEWLVEFTDDMNFANPETPTLGWEPARLPSNLRKLNTGHRGAFWIKRIVELDPDSLAPDPALQLGKIYEKDEVFFNGVLIGNNGKKANDPVLQENAYGRERLYTIPFGLVRKGPNTIAIRMQSSFKNIAGITSGPIRITSLGYAAEERFNRSLDDLIFIAFYFFIGIFFFINFVKLNEMREYFSFSIFTIIFALYLLMKNEIRFELAEWFLTFKVLEYSFLFLLPGAYLLFLKDFFNLEKMKYLKQYLIVNVTLIPLFIILRSPGLWDTMISIWSLHLLGVLGYSFIICHRKILEKNLEGFIFLVALIYFSYAIIREFMIERGLITGDSSLDRAYMLFILLMTLALRLRFIFLRLKIQKRFGQLAEVDTLRENIFKHMDRLMTDPLLKMRQMLNQIKNRDENININDAVIELKGIREFLQSAMDDILELSRLEVMTQSQFKDTVPFVDFIRAVLPEGQITYSIKVDSRVQIHNSLDLVNSIIMRLIDFPGFKDFTNLDLIITSDLHGQLHFRFMLYHKNPRVTLKLYDELTGKKTNTNSVKWAIIKETLRLLEGRLEMTILSRKYLRIDFELRAVPMEQPKIVPAQKQSGTKRFHIELPEFIKKRLKK